MHVEQTMLQAYAFQMEVGEQNTHTQKYVDHYNQAEFEKDGKMENQDQ
jgi:hypothetical protein